MSVLVVGSVAFDDIETPSGKATGVLGGSATYFSLAASCYAPVRLVGNVGEDFPMDLLRRHEDRGLDLSGIEVVKGGRTFRWEGRYRGDMNAAETLKTELGVLATFEPRVPESFRDTPFVFLANTHPAVQLKVLEQVRRPKFVLADTMNLWIEHELPALKEVLKRVDGLLLNDGEARMLTGERNLIAAGRKILDMGPKVVVVKKGEHGSFLFSTYQFFALPAYPIETVTDPTGAGDTFAGGLVGSLARSGAVSIGNIKRGMVHGTVTASFAVEKFGTDGIAGVNSRIADARFEEFLQFVTV